MKYLVESHLGGIYVSSQDKEIITSICEECGDSDTIIASWTNEEEKENEIKKYIVSKYIYVEADAENYIKLMYEEGYNLKEFVEEIIYDRECVRMDNAFFIDTLLSCNCIDKKLHRSLMHTNTLAYKKELKTIKKYIYSCLENVEIIDSEEKENETIFKIKIRKNKEN